MGFSASGMAIVGECCTALGVWLKQNNAALPPQQFSTLFIAASGSGAKLRPLLQPIPLLPLTPTNRIKLSPRGTFTTPVVTAPLPSLAPSSPSTRLYSPTALKTFSLVKQASSAAFQTLELQEDCIGLLPRRVLSPIFTKALPRPLSRLRRRLLGSQAAPQPQMPPKDRRKGWIWSRRPGTNEAARTAFSLLYSLFYARQYYLFNRVDSRIFCCIDSNVPKYLQYFTWFRFRECFFIQFQSRQKVF
jgi:hypothetical protein